MHPHSVTAVIGLATLPDSIVLHKCSLHTALIVSSFHSHDNYYGLLSMQNDSDIAAADGNKLYCMTTIMRLTTVELASK